MVLNNQLNKTKQAHTRYANKQLVSNGTPRSRFIVLAGTLKINIATKNLYSF